MSPPATLTCLHVGDPGLDTPLIRSALPVLRSLRENLQGQPVSVMLPMRAAWCFTG